MGISVSRPVAMWNKPLNVNFKDLFKSLSKGVIHSVSGSLDSVAIDVVDASTALGLAKKPEEVAWLLIYRSLTQAMFSLAKENTRLLKFNKTDRENLCNDLDLSLEEMQLTIDQEFFKRPKNSPIIEAIKTPFTQWLEGIGLNKASAQTISNRLPTYFVYALNEEWATHHQDYACLKEKLDTPFTQAGEREQAWLRYFAKLQKQVDESMLSETFSLKQLYVSLYGYYNRKIDGQKDEEFPEKIAKDKQYKRVVVNLADDLQAWLNKADRNDAIRIISGGPGSGKSSFAKIFAASLAEKEIPVLFIPLHHFHPSDDLVDAVGKFVSLDGFLRHNPLEDTGDSRLLIIFDGLDELAMQGKIAADVAQQFVREVQKKVDRFNQDKTHLQVLISGRELVVQANNSEFRQPQQILHILPYFVKKDEREVYVDTNNLLNKDQRQLWWQKYGDISGKGYTGLPQELNQDNLTEITSQPLLSYLVALSFVEGEVKFSQESNLNTVYANLLRSVYKREWTGYQHQSIQGIEEKDFVRILEEIALSSWHGDGRTTTVVEIKNHCDNSGLTKLLELFQESAAQLGVARLLIAFYFRQSGLKEGEKTFEFTHKTFGEYLTGKRIVREVKLIHKKLEERQNDPDEGWDVREALRRWATLCGASAMDVYLFDFVLNEMRLQEPEDVGHWQRTLCHLIGFMLRYGMPMERLNPRLLTFQEENRQARNAEEALLAVLNACARVNQVISEIKWPSPDAFGTWIARLQGQRTEFENVLFLECLSFLDLQKSTLYLRDLYGANLQGANLEGANLEGAILQRANLEGANLEGANLQRAILQRANLQRANLEGANLEGAILQGAILEGANLQRAILEGANLERAILEGANLQGANLEGVNLSGVKNLTPKQVQQAQNWEKAKYYEADRAKLGLPPEPAK